MERRIKILIVITIILSLILGGSIGYMLGSSDSQQRIIDSISEKYDCKLRISVGEPFARINISINNLSQQS